MTNSKLHKQKFIDMKRCEARRVNSTVENYAKENIPIKNSLLIRFTSSLMSSSSSKSQDVCLSVKVVVA
ncbi:CLUMA_CG000671, isoform A [Clunio marinus]|uniref:CLUMA_CG000671, isoform A n=1 Tax=Clunio marinus TaxID=568069 RepID=A0A1J1HHE8_9DIPT|nr:CLUMA_CG000671, isoform A [Clunio marinus]